MSLRDELTEISGVGDATADKIISVVESQSNEDVAETLAEAIEYYESGSPEYAMGYVRDAYNEVK